VKVGLALIAALVAAPALAAEIDWRAVTAPDVVRIVTIDPDGDVRETKVWIAFADGSGWLRTSNSRWLENLRRDPNAKLISGDQELELRADEIEDPAARERVDAAMRAKYGWSDRMLGFLRMRGSQLLRLSARTP
jgi:hypothetical protein